MIIPMTYECKFKTFINDINDKEEYFNNGTSVITINYRYDGLGNTVSSLDEFPKERIIDCLEKTLEHIKNNYDDTKSDGLTYWRI